MATIQSNLVPIQLRVKGSSTWLDLVCLTSYNIPVETATNNTETFCGTAVGLGAISFNPTGTAVAETVPTGTQVTYDQIIAWQMQQTLLEFRSLYETSGGSAGNHFYLSGDCYVTSTNLQFQTAQAVQFDWTLTGSGTLDYTP